MATSNQISKKRKFVADGIFFAEVNEFLRRFLAEDGYAGVEVIKKPAALHVVIQCTKTPEVVKKIPDIQKLLQLRHGFTAKSQNQLKVFAEKVTPRGLSARAQAQSICYKLKFGVAVRRACYGVLKYIMDKGQAKGVQIIISGKLRGARAKAMKFKDGFMISSGDATNYYIKEAVEHVLLRSGTIGVRVKIMLPKRDQFGGEQYTMLPAEDLPDVVTVVDKKKFSYADDDGIPIFQQPTQDTQGGPSYNADYSQEPQQPPAPIQEESTAYQPPVQHETPGGYS